MSIYQPIRVPQFSILNLFCFFILVLVMNIADLLHYPLAVNQLIILSLDYIIPLYPITVSKLPQHVMALFTVQCLHRPWWPVSLELQLFVPKQTHNKINEITAYTEYSCVPVFNPSKPWMNFFRFSLSPILTTFHNNIIIFQIVEQSLGCARIEWHIISSL